MKNNLFSILKYSVITSLLLIFCRAIDDLWMDTFSAVCLSKVISCPINDIVIITVCLISVFGSFYFCYKSRKFKFLYNRLVLLGVFCYLYYIARYKMEYTFVSFYIHFLSQFYYTDFVVFSLLIIVLLLSQSEPNISHAFLDKIKDRMLKEYLSCKNPDYAIMMNGTWGAGKTYYVKNKLYEELYDAKYKPVYVSLYGIKNTEELVCKINDAIYPYVSNPLFGYCLRFFKKISSQLGFEIGKDDVEYLLNSIHVEWKKIVMFFDDLERVEKSEINNILGTINDYIEHHSCYVVIVANENEMRNDKKNKDNKEYIDN